MNTIKIAAITDELRFDIISDLNEKVFRSNLVRIDSASPDKVYEKLTADMFHGIILDIQGINCHIDDFISLVRKLRLSLQSRMILMVPYTEETIVVRELSNMYDAVISGHEPSVIRQELIKTIQDILHLEPSTAAKQDHVQELTFRPKEFPIKKEIHHTLTIGVAGALSRIGTTTQCLQAVRFLQTRNKKACYVEMNGGGHIQAYPAGFPEAVDDSAIGCVTYQGIEMYYKPNMIAEIMAKQYDAIVYDYGTFSGLERSARDSYLERQVKLMVCGAKPYELPHLWPVFEALDNDEIEYIFSFIHTNSVNAVSVSMKNLSNVTHFSGDTRDPFSFSADNEGYLNSILHSHLSLNPLSMKPEMKKKGRWEIPFWRNRS